MTAKEALATIRKNYPYQEFDLFRTLEKALEELEAIKSADGGEAMESLKLLDEEWQTGEELETEEQIAHCSALENAGDIIENYILKAQAQERELRELKKDISRFLYLQTGRISITGEFQQDFVIENKPHPLAHETSVERNLKREYKELRDRLELVGESDV